MKYLENRPFRKESLLWLEEARRQDASPVSFEILGNSPSQSINTQSS